MSKSDQGGRAILRIDRIVFTFLLLLVALLRPESASTLDNGLARTPPMGWNSWATYELNINEALIRSTADAMVLSGMKDAGYEYVVVDAGWKATARDAEGRLSADPDKFPSGMKALADYVHSKGLKFGIYTDAGSEDCVAGAPGSKGFEEKDASLFAAWGVDYVKEDWCNTMGMNAREAYTKMSRALLATGRPMVFSMCEWGDSLPWNWGAPTANLWRTTGDSKDCWDCGRKTMKKPGGYPRGWTLILDAQAGLASFAGPGHWNDPDLLQVGHPGLTIEEDRAQFSLWAILAGPLMTTNDVRSMSADVHGILTNPEVIAIDQDAGGRQGTRVGSSGKGEVWMRSLRDGSRAVVLFNRSKSAKKISVRWSEIDEPESDGLLVRDLWQRRDLGIVKDGYSAVVAAHGVVMIRVSAAAK